MKRAMVGVLMAAALALPEMAAAQKYFEPLFPGEGGCLAEGQGPDRPGVTTRECTYTAHDGDQDVTAVTINEWFIFVRRNCPSFPVYCKPILQDDQCFPAEENECPPFRGENGDLILDPKAIILLEGRGLPYDEIFYTVHPEPGELVTVRINNRDDLPPGSQAYGFVEVSDPDASED